MFQNMFNLTLDMPQNDMFNVHFSRGEWMKKPSLLGKMTPSQRLGKSCKIMGNALGS